ncbi:ATP-dependent helicase [Crenobacter sp. SG2305]|uniref:ATP-dependent helicase n=1 Tax=Crenobacter oryzisoli TaxID=3056844 RepID=UPI0025AA7EFE|nr:ATP-dependent helicase [Crenobacter sp. SG2305]MDN0082336.1 ATP-dependent helicase [Crenobacter sp. SG2305]
MLNTAQQQAVDADGHTLVVALPGAGKTHMSVLKIDRLLSLHPQNRIGAVTFTRDSAEELKTRIVRVSGEEKAKRTLVGTFHKHSIIMLRAANKMPKIVGGGQQFSILNRAIEMAEADMKAIDAAKILERIKCSAEQLPETATEERLFNAYRELLSRHGMCDLQDVVRMALNGMQDGTVPALPVSHLLVDEFQDTDECQLQWVLEHARRGAIITVVGDDDQSIYGWRHALGYAGMMRFKEEVGAELINLGSNYRCRKEILDSAEKVIRNNDNRVVKTMLAERGPGGQVDYRKYADRANEVEAMIASILSTPGIIQEEGDFPLWRVPEGSWAVLARNNHLLRMISAEMTAAGVAHKLASSDKDMWAVPPLCYVADLLGSLADGTTRGIENTMSMVGVSERCITQLNDISKGRLKPLLKTMPKLVGVDKKEADAVSNLLNLVAGWKEQIAQGRLNLGLQGVRSYVLAHVPAKMASDLDFGVNILVNKLRGSLAERLKVVLKPREDPRTENEDKRHVKLMTMHGSKGLEFDNVWLPAAETGIIPSEGGTEGPSDLEEERRLFYVGMTRAKNHLTVSHTSLATASLFIKESGIPETVLQ